MSIKQNKKKKHSQILFMRAWNLFWFTKSLFKMFKLKQSDEVI